MQNRSILQEKLFYPNWLGRPPSYLAIQTIILSRRLSPIIVHYRPPPGGLTHGNIHPPPPKVFVPARIIVIFVCLKLSNHLTASIRTGTNRR